MTLYEFIEIAVEAMEGILVPIEYALCSVLLPEKYKDAFQGKNELLLAFDYEVAQENPNSEFVTYGSYIYDTILQIARTYPLTTQRYASVERLELNNAAEKIKKQIAFEAGTIDIVSERKVVGLWALYNFTVLYAADERFEETREVWVNLTNGTLDTHLTKNIIFYEIKDTLDALPYLHPVSMKASYETSYQHIEAVAADKARILENDVQINREIDRIKYYYDEMVIENKKRMNRKGVTEEKINEIRQKEKALILERNKQMHEIEEKNRVKTTILLENTVVYHIPIIEFLCRMNCRRRISEQFFYYDPICKRIIEGV